MTTAQEPDGRERREHNRIRLNLKSSVEIDGEPTPVMDVSWGGICLHSKEAKPEGLELSFFVGGLIVSARVLACVPLENVEPGSDIAYQIRCQFIEAPEHRDIQALMNVVWAKEFGAQ